MANVVVGVTGGIAAYKTASLIRLFAEAGHTIQVVATKNAFNFIGRSTLEALSGNQVSVVDPDLFTDVDQVKHVAIGKSAELIVVAPATASFIAKVSAGIADDLLTTTVLAAKCPVVLAPAMHTEMWDNKATQANISLLKSRDINIIWPGTGRLTGEDSGVGRLAEPKEIFESALATLGVALKGVRVVVTAGGTREPIDAARYIGNFSSGKQGLAFVKAAKRLGANVTLIAANLEQELGSDVATIRVATAKELSNEIGKLVGDFDLLIMAAAVADYRPSQIFDGKLKRATTGQELDIELVANEDILKGTVAKLKSASDSAVVIGFAAEASGDLEKLAREKLSTKGCDYIVANDITDGAIFGQDDTNVLLVTDNSSKEFNGSKENVATAILNEIAARIKKS
jgi:phosphopantothenoylcysteine decarboxylase / phosphopantothenate---cysteine ligase